VELLAVDLDVGIPDRAVDRLGDGFEEALAFDKAQLAASAGLRLSRRSSTEDSPSTKPVVSLTSV
jgi:hypothetical protein